MKQLVLNVSDQFFDTLIKAANGKSTITIGQGTLDNISISKDGSLSGDAVFHAWTLSPTWTKVRTIIEQQDKKDSKWKNLA